MPVLVSHITGTVARRQGGCMKSMISFEARAGTSGQEGIEPAMDFLGDV